MAEKAAIKMYIINEVSKAIKRGFGGVDTDPRIPDYLSNDIKAWCYTAFNAQNYIDWDRDDPFGRGIGRNAQGAVCKGITFDFFP